MKKLLFQICMFISITAFAQSNITWNMGMNISTSNYSNMHPRMTLDRAGNPLVIWGRMSDQSVFFSRWNGSMFTTPVKLNPSWLTVATGSWMGPDIASHGDTVYVVVKRTPETSNTNRIYIFTSFNAGVSFNTPVELGFIADSISRFPTVTTDPTGNPIVAFMKFNSTFGDSRWVVTKSTDYGNTFSIDTKASGWGNSSEVCDCCPGAIVSDANKCAMLYRNNNNNNRDTWAGISVNNATIFTSGHNLENNNWMLMMCPSSGPDGVIKGDTLYSVFMNGISGLDRVYFSKSSISTNTVGSITPITGIIPGLNQQNYPRIALDGNAMAVVWKQVVNNADQLPLLFTNNYANGFQANYDTVDLADITNTDVALKNGKIFVIWQDDGSGTVKYRSGTYTQVNSGIDTFNSTVFSISPNPSSGIFTVTKQTNKVASVIVYDIMGNQIQKFNMNNKTSTIDLSVFSKGIYFVKLSEGNKIYSKKIVVE